MRAFCLDQDDASTARQAGQGSATAGRRARPRQAACCHRQHLRATDDERRGIVRSMQLMSDEATALTRELRESTASQLQAVLDHVKDVIVTVDDAGHIASLNATGQRVFGHAEAGRSPAARSASCCRSSPTSSPSPRELEQLAARLDDTQVDLAPHETLGLHSNGTYFPAELAVSKTQLNRRDAVRRLPARHHRSQGGRSGAARQRGALSHAGRARAGDHRGRRSRPQPARRTSTRTPCASSRWIARCC